MPITEGLRLRFENAGVWSKFCRIRQTLKDRGRLPPEAQEIAITETERIIAGGTSEYLAAVVPLRELFARKPPATVLDNYKWVAANLIYDEKELDIDMCPSAEALGLHRWARANQSEFYAQYKNLLPTKAQVDTMEKNRDDGRFVLDKIEELRRSRGLVRACSEDVSREP